MSVFREYNVSGLAWEVVLDSSQEIVWSLYEKQVGFLRKNVAMVLIKLLPNRI